MGGHNFFQYDRPRLARAVLGEEEGNFEKPGKIKCREGPLMHELRLLSDDLIKCAIAETFLVCEMGSRLLHHY